MTLSRLATPALAALILLAGCGQKPDDAAEPAKVTAAPIAPPAGQQWTEVTAVSPVGGFVMGNPNAPVKLIEYGSLTCPHCAEFSRTGTEGMQKLIATGQLSWEFRPFLLNGIDVPLSLMARCQGAAPFFKLMEQLYAGQHDWITKFQGISEADQKRIQSLPPQQAFAELARLSDMTSWFRVRGVPEARLDACLSDANATNQLEALQKQGAADGVPGTPAFLINGTLVKDVATWEGLEPKLKAAIG